MDDDGGWLVDGLVDLVGTPEQWKEGVESSVGIITALYRAHTFSYHISPNNTSQLWVSSISVG